MMYSMKTIHTEFKWCKYVLMKHGITNDIFLHTKPFLFVPGTPILYQHQPKFLPYLHLMSALYRLVNIPHFEEILDKAKHYDQFVQMHGISLFMIRRFIADMDFLNEDAWALTNNWV